MPTRNVAWPPGTPCWVDCQMDDVAATAHFYGSLLGWEIREEPPEIPGYLVGYLGGRKVAGIGGKGGVDQPSVWSIYLATDDLDASVRRSLDAGGTVMTPPRRIGEDGRMSFGTDSRGAPFGLWESGLHTGFGVFNEPGTVCWNELHTGDYDAARWYYSQVFGWTYTDLDEYEPQFTYSYLHVPDTPTPVGGVNLHPRPAGGPPLRNHWLTWFAVEGLDRAVDQAVSLGGGVLHAPQHSGHGQQAVLVGREGEPFGLLEAGRTPGP